MYKLIKAVLPDSLNKWILLKIRGVLSKHSKFEDSQIPKVTLSQKHINNTEFLLNRTELLKRLPKNGIAAEMGVDEGGFSQKILKYSDPQKLHLIDFWGSKRYNTDKKQQVHSLFKTHLESGKVEINLGLSTDVYSDFSDNYFDWIYIDTAHSYAVTKLELELYESKIKPGGIIAGHDFMTGNWNGNIRYGVIESVYEFCVNRNWEIIYITGELDDAPSFAIKKIVD
ncbi:MAG: hypothetical protein ACJATA_001631 [Sphingobacteriales bacterium]|jgi:hypothetical protein